jgi:ABC-type nickel/cobalt efflux system permease component RcnA
MPGDTLIGLFAGAAGLGVLHGAEPGHGWPVAAAWALARRAPRTAGVLAATVIGLGHLVSSIAVVVLFFAAKQWLDLGELGWIDWVAGGLLLALAAWQLRAGLRGEHHHHHHGHAHGHAHGDAAEPSPAAGLGALAAFAFTLGFAHEEEFQIIALCAGSDYCLELMLTYALAVIGALIVLTLLLVAGMGRFRHRLDHAQRALTLLSAAILAAMGVGFLAGVF